MENVEGMLREAAERGQETWSVELRGTPREGRRYRFRRMETWLQDEGDPDLWHGPGGLIVNGAALAERRWCCDVVRLRRDRSEGAAFGTVSGEEEKGHGAAGLEELP